MMRLAWVRTVLVAIAFVWAMLAWHLHERAIDRERGQILELAVRLCAADYPDSPEDRDECEIDYRIRVLNGMSVNGSLSVSGAADADVPAGPNRARAVATGR